MATKSVPNYIFGGVDVRSNPCNRPVDRALRCKNWVPTEAGYLQLREGYSEVTMDSVTATAIHSMDDYKLWDGTRYLLFIQGTDLKRLNKATGAVTTIATLSSSARAEFAKSDNKIWIANGTDQKFYDGTTLRDIGIRASTATDVASVVITEALRGPSSSEYSSVSILTSGAGPFPATTSRGILFYLHYIEPAGYGLGPGQVLGARQTLAAPKQYDFTNLPDLSAVAVATTWKKVISRTNDGDSIAKMCTTASAAITNLSFNASSRVMTVTATAHGFASGDAVEIAVTGWEHVALITVTDANTFTYNDIYHRSDAGATGAVSGTAYRCVTVATATTTVSLTSTSRGSLQANTDIGLLKSTLTTNAGFQLYASIYNPTTLQPGNRIKIEGRFDCSTASTRAIFLVTGLASLAGENSEWSWLIGRTGDGAEVPYAIADSSLNLKYIDNARTTFLLRDSGIDGDKELPTRNDKPSGFVQIVRAGDRLYARKSGDPKIYYTDDVKSRKWGKSEQSWYVNNFETFPTGEDVLCIAEFDHECVAFTANYCAALSDVAGVLMWRGPWNIGIAGARAFTQTSYGPYWLSGEKELVTITAEGPTIVSDEYDKALLDKIDATYLSTSEVAYLRDKKKGIDHVKVKGRDSSGNPFEVRHDFKLRDNESPFGQAYEAVYVGDLASDYTMKQVRDSNGKMRVWAGGSDGQIYELEHGPDDNGTDFTARYTSLVNWGEQFKSLPYLYIYGDGNIKMYRSRALNTNETQLQQQEEKAKAQTGNMAEDFKFRFNITSVGVDSPEFIEFELTSHPDDATSPSDPMALSDPPHLPVEDYGRLYMAQPAFADVRGE